MTDRVPDPTASGPTGDLAIVVSEADEASVHVGERLREIADWEATTDDERAAADGGGTLYRRPGAELRTFERRHLETEGIADAFDDPALVVFASRHAGETGPLLTAHHTGNFGPAEYGGADRALARAAPAAHRRVVSALREHAPEGYDVGMECTHHGPTDVGVPSLFVEVGSGPDEWADPDAAGAVARATLDLVEDGAAVAPDAPVENGHRRHLVGFGGGHYAPRYERILRETDWAVGHVAADWCLDEMGDPAEATGVLAATFAESAADVALLEGDRPALVDAVESLGHRVVGETWVRETRGVPLGLVERLEDALGSVADGLRFGAPARERDAAPGTVAVGEVPADLLSAANGVDEAATREAIAGVALGFDTEHGGVRATGPVALEREADEAALLAPIVDVLREEYDAVEVAEGAIRARRREFDPSLAREAGVDPGPAFGRLAGGEAVEVDGDRVRPEQVTVEREYVFDASVTD